MEQIIGQSTQTAKTTAQGGPLVKEGSQATFMQDVIETSRSVPVLVHFWANKYDPCKKLTPVLEKIVTTARGRIKLVKIDIEANRSLVMQLLQMGLPLQSVPLVAAFWQGHIVDLFQGNLPENQVKTFVENLLKTTGGSVLPATERLSEAETALADGNPDIAIELYSSVLEEEPENTKAWGGLIRAFLASNDETAATEALANVPEKIAQHSDITSARTALELKKESYAAAQALEGVRSRVAANPNDFEARCELATALNATNKREEAADELLYIIRADRHWKDDAAKQQLLRFFEAWGHSDPATIAARRRLSALLFS